jgi:hypothetical protein
MRGSQRRGERARSAARVERGARGREVRLVREGLEEQP